MGFSGDEQVAGLSTVDNEKLFAAGDAHGNGTLKQYRFTKTEPQKVFINAVDSADTTRTRVLLFGDSELDHLRTPVYNYCRNNNCDLVATITWYGSTTVQWGKGDSLQKYLDKYKPDFVFCVLGLNELFIPNVEPRREPVQHIQALVKQSGAKFYWVGPAAWKEDQGICNMLREEVDTLCYYPSNKLTLERANDHRHPSRDGSKVWFDSVAVAVTRDTRLDFSHTVATYESPKNSPSIVIPMSK